MSEDELVELASMGKIDGETLVWRSSMSNWEPLKNAPGVPQGALTTLPPEAEASPNAAPPPLVGAMGPPIPPVATPMVAPVQAASPEPELLGVPALNRPKLMMPLPSEPVVERYGKEYAKVHHHIHLYPAFLRRKKGPEAKEILEEDESSCFYHPQFAATNVCSHSGRFICDLCTTEWNGEIISLQALNEIKSKGKNAKLSDSKKLWDDIALALVLLPIVVFPLLYVTAPLAVIISLWKWKQGPTSIVRRSRVRYIFAIIIGLIEIVFLAMLAMGYITFFDDF